MIHFNGSKFGESHIQTSAKGKLCGLVSRGSVVCLKLGIILQLEGQSSIIDKENTDLRQNKNHTGIKKDCGLSVSKFKTIHHPWFMSKYDTRFAWYMGCVVLLPEGRNF